MYDRDQTSRGKIKNNIALSVLQFNVLAVWQHHCCSEHVERAELAILY